MITIAHYSKFNEEHEACKVLGFLSGGFDDRELSFRFDLASIRFIFIHSRGFKAGGIS
jgi:hypothetical protein